MQIYVHTYVCGIIERLVLFYLQLELLGVI